MQSLRNGNGSNNARKTCRASNGSSVGGKWRWGMWMWMWYCKWTIFLPILFILVLFNFIYSLWFSSVASFLSPSLWEWESVCLYVFVPANRFLQSRKRFACKCIHFKHIWQKVNRIHSTRKKWHIHSYTHSVHGEGTERKCITNSISRLRTCASCHKPFTFIRSYSIFFFFFFYRLHSLALLRLLRRGFSWCLFGCVRACVCAMGVRDKSPFAYIHFSPIVQLCMFVCLLFSFSLAISIYRSHSLLCTATQKHAIPFHFLLLSVAHIYFTLYTILISIDYNSIWDQMQMKSSQLENTTNKQNHNSVSHNDCSRARHCECRERPQTKIKFNYISLIVHINNSTQALTYFSDYYCTMFIFISSNIRNKIQSSKWIWKNGRNAMPIIPFCRIWKS